MTVTDPTTEVHCPIPTQWRGHWMCSCGYVGTECMIDKHLADDGQCSECWGSSSDAYPSLGICWVCRGTGEAAGAGTMDEPRENQGARFLL